MHWRGGVVIEREGMRERKEREETTLSPGTQGQASRKVRRQENKPQSLRDLYNTTSCIPPPFRCPHPRMQMFCIRDEQSSVGSFKAEVASLSHPVLSESQTGFTSDP
ncbi:hypothetical protein EVAR_33293_1 [Eumeta japonica]|uniref:Uncharacterized protein n=1 Tax=Eumeta variegata TaxID=151549 RepID=A0A4C1WFQ1_EUMVA|nr:hypothetical protein EVAR_33293_1 [Eumeta japonica]